MTRVKVIKDITDFVPILRAVNTRVKRNVFTELAQDWVTADDIEGRFGEEGKSALKLFEKMKLLETRWQHTGRETKKAYHTYYSAVHIDASAPINEISDILYAAMVEDHEFREMEEKIIDSIKEGNDFAKDMENILEVSPVTLKSLIKRSVRLDFRGNKIIELSDD